VDIDTAALITADADDLTFCINAIRQNPHIPAWLAIEFDGARSTAVVRVTSAAFITDVDDDYWALDCEITELHSAPGTDVGYRLHDQCTLTAPVDTRSHSDGCGFLSRDDIPRRTGNHLTGADTQEPGDQQKRAGSQLHFLALHQDNADYSA